MLDDDARVEAFALERTTTGEERGQHQSGEMSTRLVFRWFEGKTITLVPAVAVGVQGMFLREFSTFLFIFHLLRMSRRKENGG